MCTHVHTYVRSGQTHIDIHIHTYTHIHTYIHTCMCHQRTGPGNLRSGVLRYECLYTMVSSIWNNSGGRGTYWSLHTAPMAERALLRAEVMSGAEYNVILST